ncbi:MAG TPA: hypothetical protein VKI62_00390 [Bacteroidota bacterium]|nr:hypothetical protein [Bacteroidota bacterium]
MRKPVETDSAKRESTATTDQQKKKRKVESVAVAKKPAAQLEKWATKRQELKSETDDSTNNEVSEFADLNQMCCLLCKRKFQSIEEIQKHERLSKLHKVSRVF